MTITDRFYHCEKGSVAIEAVFVLMFFSGLFIYTFQQAYTMVLNYSAEKIASQAVGIISQRAILFNDKNLQAKDIELLRKHIPAIADPGDVLFDLHVEEIAYQTGEYSVVHIPAKSGSQCTLRKKLSDYNFSVKTSFAKNNSIYRVTACKKITSMYYSDDELVIGSSMVMPGYHH
ncbi:hypothetical protein GWD52_19985 [Enterobacteriaceae bacterium 4M9]|nr:hypothetical protein [Enterobacteriaceae bacterium 4M9]